MSGHQNYAETATVLLAQTTLLLLAVFILSRRLNSRGPAVNALVLKAALIGIVALCAVPLIPFRHRRSLIHVSPPAAISLFSAPQPDQTPKQNALRTQSMPAKSPSIGSSTFASEDLSASLPQPIRARQEPVTLASLALSAWLIGTCLLFAWLIWAQACLAFLRIKSHRILEGFAFDRLQELCQARGLRTPELRVHPAVDGPFLLGIFRPAILMNMSAVEELDASTLDLIFEHEVAHLRGRDCAWRLVERILCALLWPQPLLWRLCLRLDRCSEELCDQVVIANSSTRRKYADCLLALADGSWYSRAERTFGVGVVPFRSQIGRRIATILDGSQRFSTRLSGRSRLAIAGLTAGFAAATVLAVSGSLPVSQDKLKPVPFDKRSDPRAVSLWREVQKTYGDLTTFSTTIKITYRSSPNHHRGEVLQTELVDLVYKSPSNAIVKVLDGNGKRVHKVVTIAGEQDATIWPKKPEIYQIFRDSDHWKDNGSVHFPQTGLFAMRRRADLGFTTVNALLENLMFPPEKDGGTLTFGPDAVLHGEAVSTLLLTKVHEVNNQTVKATITIGKKDHLVKTVEEIEHLGPTGETFSITEEYRNVRIDPQIDDSLFAFHPSAGAVSMPPVWGPPMYGPGVRDLLDKVKATYRNLKSLSLVATSTEFSTLSATLKKPGFAKIFVRDDLGTRPNQYSVADGINNYVWAGERAKKYFVAPASPTNIEFFDRTGLSVVSSPALLENIAWALGDESNHFILNSGDLKLGPSGVLYGVKVDKILSTSFETDPDGMPIETSIRTATYSFGHDDHLLRQIRSSYHEIVHGRVAEGESYDTIAYRDVDKPLDTNFRFHPGSMTRAKTPVEFEQSIPGSRTRGGK